MSARVLPIFSETSLTEKALSEAVAHVREAGKDRLRDRWAVRDVVDADLFPDDEESASDVDLSRPTCPTGEGEHGEAWALVVHVARKLGYSPRDIHQRDEALFGAVLPCKEHNAECPYSAGWDAVSDPDDPDDLLVGSYVHGHVESARTYYERTPAGGVSRSARTVVLDEYPGRAFAEEFGDEALDHAAWLGRALHPDVEDRQDLFEVDLWGDEFLPAWLAGEADAELPAVEDAVEALTRGGALLEALDTAAELADDYRDVLEMHDLEDPVDRLLDDPDLTPEEFAELAGVLRERAGGVPPEDKTHAVVRWFKEDVVEGVEAAATGPITPDVDALPGGGELHRLVERANRAVREREVEHAGVVGAARDALVGGEGGARELAVWADDGYAHPDAHYLLEAVARPQGDDRVTRVHTENFSYDPEAEGTALTHAEIGDRDTVLLDRNHHGATIHTPPSRVSGGGDPVPVVGLDATARKPLWEEVLGEEVAVADIHDTPRERAEFLRDVMGLQIVQTSGLMRPYEGDPGGKDLDGDVALLQEIAGEFTGVRAARERGEEATPIGRPAAITTKVVRDRLEDDPRLADAVAEWENYGNVTGANDLGDHRLAAILGSQHYGHAAVEYQAALAGEEVDITGRGNALDYGNDLANTYLRHMREDQVMQAALRFTRGESGATVFARTAALRDDLPVVGRGQVVESWNATATAIARGWRRVGGEFTVDDVADTVDVSRRQVRRVLEEFADAGYVEIGANGPGRANTYTPTGAPNAGEVDLPAGVEPLDGPRPGHAPHSVTYTWNDRVDRAALVSPGGVSRRSQLPAPGTAPKRARGGFPPPG